MGVGAAAVIKVMVSRCAASASMIDDGSTQACWEALLAVNQMDFFI